MVTVSLAPTPNVVGTLRQVVLPHSEVCMSMGVAGKEMTCRHEGRHMVQLLNEDGTQFSFPITEGEAGWGRMGSDLTLCTFDANGRWTAI